MLSFSRLAELMLGAALGITLLHPASAVDYCGRQRWQCFANHGASGSSVSNRLIGEPLLLNMCSGGGGSCTVFNCGNDPHTECNKRYSDCNGDCGTYDLMNRRYLRYAFGGVGWGMGKIFVAPGVVDPAWVTSHHLEVRSSASFYPARLLCVRAGAQGRGVELSWRRIRELRVMDGSQGVRRRRCSSMVPYASDPRRLVSRLAWIR
jgi:hypothetical protein